MPTDDLLTAIARWRVRRHAWFCLYYRSRPSSAADDQDARQAAEQSAGAWASLSELDLVLNDCQDAGLIQRFWQSHPPLVDGYHGGIAEDVLRARLGPDDLAALGLK